MVLNPSLLSVYTEMNLKDMNIPWTVNMLSGIWLLRYTHTKNFCKGSWIFTSSPSHPREAPHISFMCKTIDTIRRDKRGWAEGDN